MRERALDSGEDWDVSPTGLLVPPRRRRQFDRPIAIDLFAGCGGMSTGLKAGRFHVIAALEYESHAAITYAVNLGEYGVTEFHFGSDELRERFEKTLDPKRKMQKALDAGAVTPALCADFPMVGTGWISKRRDHEPGSCASHMREGAEHYEDHSPDELAEKRAGFCDTYHLGGRDFDALGCEHVWIWDAAEITGEQLLAPMELLPGEVDLVAGGPPCQGFSHAGRRKRGDPRNNLVFEFARLVCEIQPKSMVMENVPGIASMRLEDGRSVIDEFCAVLERGDYAEHEATRRALLARTDAGHVRRGKSAQKGDGETKPGRRRVDRGADDPDEAEQLALSMGAAA